MSFDDETTRGLDEKRIASQLSEMYLKTSIEHAQNILFPQIISPSMRHSTEAGEGFPNGIFGGEVQLYLHGGGDRGISQVNGKFDASRRVSERLVNRDGLPV